MNEKIKQLAEQAQQYAECTTPQGLEWFDVFKEKFAGLIIQECAHIADKNQAEDMGWDISEIIKEHFGVKP